MCTLIIGHGMLGDGTLVIAANRDEDPARPTDPPGALQAAPRLVGGRDRVAGGTWLAIRESQVVVAMLNRAPSDVAEAQGEVPRSRGLLTLEVAAARGTGERIPREELSRAILDTALWAVRQAKYAPFSLACASPEASWVMSRTDAASASVEHLSPGWHALTHAGLDDPREPRTVRLLRELSSWRPRSPEEARRGLVRCLSLHRASSAPAEPPVCIHDGRMVTVSCSIVCLGRGEASYWHAEGKPCERPLMDLSHLLAG